MVDYNKLNQFISIKSLSKYGKFGGLTFDDGTLVSIWFRKNKDDIFSSDNELCRKVKKEYEKFIDNGKNKTTFNNIYISDKNILAEEFYLCKSDDKFKNDSKLCFEKGISMNEWFIKNKRYILESKSKVCIEIINQYKIYLYNLRQQKIISNHRYKIHFLNEFNLKKFNYSYNFKFDDGTLMSLWFYSNKERFKDSDSPIDTEIWQQYMTYWDLRKLKEEFMNSEDFSKFDPESALRFSTGALMCDWWLSNQDDIFNYNTEENRYIIRQYNEYLNNKYNNAIVKKMEV